MLHLVKSLNKYELRAERFSSLHRLSDTSTTQSLRELAQLVTGSTGHS